MIFIMTATMTKQRSVIRYLASGRSLNQDRAMDLFGVRNLRATISDVREKVERFGNWRIVRIRGRDGTTRYIMKHIELQNPSAYTVGGRKQARTSRRARRARKHSR
jgi:hypothetical protein